MVDPKDIRAIVVGERAVSRQEVLAWESQRADVVLAKFAKRLGVRGVDELQVDPAIGELRGASLETRREALTALKIQLGHAGVYAILKHELALSDRMARISQRVSRGKVKYSVTRLTAPGLSAVRFAEWFADLVVVNDEVVMDAACPDHYLVRGLSDGRQEVVETTGGSPMAARFLVDYTRTESVTIPIDPNYPVQIAGTALLDDGLAIGGVRHQFRDRGGALEALLTVQFPATLPNRMIHQHEWHLACEFSNWLTASAPFAASGA